MEASTSIQNVYDVLKAHNEPVSTKVLYAEIRHSADTVPGAFDMTPDYVNRAAESQFKKQVRGALVRLKAAGHADNPGCRRR